MNCGFTLRTQVLDIVQRVIDARFELQISKREHETETLFNKLLQTTRAPSSTGGKHVVNFVFAGIPVCSRIWCKLHGLSTDDSRMKRVLASLRRGEQMWMARPDINKRRGWRGNLAKAWMRRHIKKTADFDPVKSIAYLDPEPVEVRHMLYTLDWGQRASGSRDGKPIRKSRFATLWKEVMKEGYTEEGETFAVVIRPPRPIRIYMHSMPNIDGSSTSICRQHFTV